MNTRLLFLNFLRVAISQLPCNRNRVGRFRRVGRKIVVLSGLDETTHVLTTLIGEIVASATSLMQ